MILKNKNKINILKKQNTPNTLLINTYNELN